MELMGLDFNSLAKETLELNHSLHGQFQFDFENQDHFDDLLSGKFEYPSRPGLIYRIDQSRSTFCVRGIATDSIRDEFRKNEELKGHAFFECPSVEIAQSVFDQIFNRRFPFHEDLMFNLSDPGFSWFMEHDEKSFKVYFKSYAASGAEKPIKLGPIGDSKVATTLIPHAVEFFRFLFPILEFSCTEKVFSLETDPQSDKTFFEFFKNVFLKGKNEFNLEEFAELPHLKTISCYLNEVASVRQFWLKIENNLNVKSDELYQ